MMIAAGVSPAVARVMTAAGVGMTAAAGTPVMIVVAGIPAMIVAAVTPAVVGGPPLASSTAPAMRPR